MPDKPMTSATDVQLSLAVQDNLFELFRAMSVIPGYELVETGKVSYHHASPTNPMFKGVWQARMEPGEADAVIDETLAWFDDRKAPYVFWWVGPGTKPADLPERLMARGMQPNMVGDPGMAADLRTLSEGVRIGDGFNIVEAHNETILGHWRDVFCASYEIPLFVGQAWVDATINAGIDRSPWRLYVGYWNGKPVATNILFCGAGVASVYGVGTLPEARGKGFGSAITLKPYLDARARGYRYGVLFATEMGHPVYKKLGFFDVPCRIGRYLLWKA